MIRESVVAITARPISCVASMAAWTRSRPFVLHETENVLQNDDGVVNDNSHGKCQREKRHVVEGEIHRPHQRESCDDRSWEWRPRR